MEVNWRDYITVDKEIMVGQPVIKGTRLTVRHVLERMAGGYSERDLLDSFPRLTPEGIRAALAYAAEGLGLEELIIVDR